MVIPEEILIAIHKFMTICCVQPEKKKKNVSVAENIPEKKRRIKKVPHLLCVAATLNAGARTLATMTVSCTSSRALH